MCDRDGYEIRKSWTGCYDTYKYGRRISSGHLCEMDARKARDDHRFMQMVLEKDAKDWAERGYKW